MKKFWLDDLLGATDVIDAASATAYLVEREDQPMAPCQTCKK